MCVTGKKKIHPNPVFQRLFGGAAQKWAQG